MTIRFMGTSQSVKSFLAGEQGWDEFPNIIAEKSVKMAYAIMKELGLDEE